MYQFRYRRSVGFTLVELALVLLISALLFSTVRPAYTHLVNEAKSGTAQHDLNQISVKINQFYKQNGHFPDSLSEVFSPVPKDPWGNPYQYLRIDGGSVSGSGKLRKDRNLVPINSDYDLYSMGPDGKSASALTASISRDDIIRGRNGSYFGVATNY
ncbi:MAG: prepilin-type cleavage/methylation domain-containing protein [Gammaproteobacteria bacterium]|jgi:general secretion pathway protein G